MHNYTDCAILNIIIIRFCLADPLVAAITCAKWQCTMTNSIRKLLTLPSLRGSRLRIGKMLLLG
uniref:Putative ORFN1 n=1 Tax=Pepper ringspot virus TaxID=31750 RepID=W0TQC8_9VIRU|nr:putative ORFN1 [Pepper ringspot virus]BAO45799.1 putative ORFN1 [Pepper ringspot virus]